MFIILYQPKNFNQYQIVFGIGKWFGIGIGRPSCFCCDFIRFNLGFICLDFNRMDVDH